MKFEIHTHKIENTAVHTLKFNYFDPSEANEFLEKHELARMNSFKSITRKQEFAATRILKHQLFGFEPIQYTEIGSPYIKGKGFISISHAKHVIGIAVNKDYQLGFDMEPLRLNIETIKDKFFGPKDKADEKLQAIHKWTKVWSGKEALYKLAGRKKIIFKSELILSHIKGDEYSGQIINPTGCLSGSLRIFEIDNLIYSINTNAFKYD